MPFADGAFDAAFTASSLHEWLDPQRTFAELARIVKPGGRIFVTDFRRDINPVFKWIMWGIANSQANARRTFDLDPRLVSPAEIPEPVGAPGFSTTSQTRRHGAAGFGGQIIAVAKSVRDAAPGWRRGVRCDIWSE